MSGLLRSSLILRLFIVLRRLKSQFSFDVRRLLSWFSWLLRRCQEGKPKQIQNQMNGQAKALGDDPHPSRVSISSQEPQGRADAVFVCASFVPYSARTDSLPNLAIARPESPGTPRYTFDDRLISTPNPTHSLSPYSAGTPVTTRSLQDTTFRSRASRGTLYMQDGESTHDSRFSATSTQNMVHKTANTRISSRAPSRHFGGGVTSDPQSRSPAPPLLSASASQVAGPRSTSIRSASSSIVEIDVEAASTPPSTTTDNVAQPFQSTHTVASEGGLSLASPYSGSATVAASSQHDPSNKVYPEPPEGRTVMPFDPDSTRRYERTYLMFVHVFNALPA